MNRTIIDSCVEYPIKCCEEEKVQDCTGPWVFDPGNGLVEDDDFVFTCGKPLRQIYVTNTFKNKSSGHSA